MAGKFYDKASWRFRARRFQLQRVPYCEKCLEERKELVAATIVHHKIDIKTAPHLAMDPENWQSLCAMHHNHAHGRGPDYSTEFGVDGMPVDRNHPIYRQR
jgi:5-methylcytosine-specific restriction endonuclease McrA